MEKLNIPVNDELVARVKTYVADGLKRSRCGGEAKEDFMTALDELLPGLVRADGGTGNLKPANCFISTEAKLPWLRWHKQNSSSL